MLVKIFVLLVLPSSKQGQNKKRKKVLDCYRASEKYLEQQVLCISSALERHGRGRGSPRWQRGLLVRTHPRPLVADHTAAAAACGHRTSTSLSAQTARSPAPAAACSHRTGTSPVGADRREPRRGGVWPSLRHHLARSARPVGSGHRAGLRAPPRPLGAASLLQQLKLAWVRLLLALSLQLQLVSSQKTRAGRGRQEAWSLQEQWRWCSIMLLAWWLATWPGSTGA